MRHVELHTNPLKRQEARRPVMEILTVTKAGRVDAPLFGDANGPGKRNGPGTPPRHRRLVTASSNRHHRHENRMETPYEVDLARRRPVPGKPT